MTNDNPLDVDLDVSDVPDDELGVALDESIDTAVEAGNATFQLEQMSVHLDEIADSNDLPWAAVQMTRMVQKQVERLRDLMDDIETVQSERADLIAERLHGD